LPWLRRSEWPLAEDAKKPRALLSVAWTMGGFVTLLGATFGFAATLQALGALRSENDPGGVTLTYYLLWWSVFLLYIQGTLIIWQLNVQIFARAITRRQQIASRRKSPPPAAETAGSGGTPTGGPTVT
jgi:hypothetical protein